MPRMVRVAWHADGKRLFAEVPVVDQYGRIAAMPLAAIGLEEAWCQLADFPLPQEEDDSGESVELGPDQEPQPDAGSQYEVPGTPIREMMELIENIASRQTEIGIKDWSLWCNRLEQTLAQAKDSSPVEAFVVMQINPLGVIYGPEFRPDFAEDATTDAGLLYERTLQRIEAAWRVAGLLRLGDRG